MKFHLDGNSILRLANLAVAILIGCAFLTVGPNGYIDASTVGLAFLLFLQTHIALQIEMRRRDPFVLLLAFTMIFYFSFRIFTLAVYPQPYSNVFRRFPFTSSDSNYGLIVILVANCLIYLGLYAVRLPQNSAIPVDGWSGTAPRRSALLLGFLITAAYVRLLVPAGSLPRLFTLLDVVVDQNFIIVMAMAYYLLFRNSLGRAFAITLAVLVVIEVLLHTFVAASRGAIVVVVESLCVVILAVNGAIKVRGSRAAGAALALPLVAAVAVGLFTIATSLRVFDLRPGNHLGSTLQQATAEAATKHSSWDELLQPIFDRAGYFDYSAELIAHRREYSAVVNLPAYFRSIVDNDLTPGFDIYDQARISYSLRFVYLNLGQAAKSLIAADYQSDQLGIYGEYFVLFGWFSLPLFFATAYLIKRYYVRISARDPFSFALKRIIVLLVFNIIINSYGFDWTIYSVISFALSAWVYRGFFACAPVGRAALGPRRPRLWQGRGPLPQRL